MICVLSDIIVEIVRQVWPSSKLPIIPIFLMINVGTNFVVDCLFNKPLFGALKTFCGKCFKCVKEVTGNNQVTTNASAESVWYSGQKLWKCFIDDRVGTEYVLCIIYALYYVLFLSFLWYDTFCAVRQLHDYCTQNKKHINRWWENSQRTKIVLW